MEAVIATGGKQYRVAPGQVIKVERLGEDKGAAVAFTRCCSSTTTGQVTVEPEALVRRPRSPVRWWPSAGRARSSIVKFKRRKNYRRHRGHRQTMTTVRITKIEV